MQLMTVLINGCFIFSTLSQNSIKGKGRGFQTLPVCIPPPLVPSPCQKKPLFLGRHYCFIKKKPSSGVLHDISSAVNAQPVLLLIQTFFRMLLIMA